MEISFWESKWHKGQIGFHMENGYEPLKKYWQKLDIVKNPNVLVPLCGKSLDIVWLAGQGAQVYGVEVIGQAVSDFFRDQQITPAKNEKQGLKFYKAGPIEIWNCDFFKLEPDLLPSIDIVYDKGGLVALPHDSQKAYVEKLRTFTHPKSKILLHHFEYPQQEMDGPPFSIPIDRIRELFGGIYTIRTLLQETSKTKYEKFRERGLKSPILERFLYLEPK